MGWARDCFFDDDGNVRHSIIGERVAVVDNGGNTYYGTVKDVIKEEGGMDPYFCCTFDPIKKKVRREGKMVEIEADVNDGGVIFL